MIVNFFCAKMTGIDDPTISCSHLMIELSVLADRKINRKGGGNHPSPLPFGRRGLVNILHLSIYIYEIDEKQKQKHNLFFFGMALHFISVSSYVWCNYFMKYFYTLCWCYNYYIKTVTFFVLC